MIGVCEQPCLETCRREGACAPDEAAVTRREHALINLVAVTPSPFGSRQTGGSSAATHDPIVTEYFWTEPVVRLHQNQTATSSSADPADQLIQLPEAGFSCYVQ